MIVTDVKICRQQVYIKARRAYTMLPVSKSHLRSTYYVCGTAAACSTLP